MATTHEIYIEESFKKPSDSIETQVLNAPIISLSDDFAKPSDSREVTTLNAPIQELSDSFSKPSDSVDTALLNASITELSDTFSKPSDSIENTVIGTTEVELSDTFSKPSNSIENLVFSSPVILDYSPSDNATTYSFYSKFSITVQSETQVYVIFELYDDTPDSEGGKQLIKSWGWFEAEQIDTHKWYCEYKIKEDLDGYLLPGFYNLKIRVKNEAPEGYNYTEKWVKFNISKANIEIRFENLEFLIEKNQLRFTFKVRHLNEIWCSLYNLLVNRYTNKPFEILEVEYDDDYTIRDKTLLIKTSEDWKYLKITVRYEVKGELVDVANKLKNSKVSIGLKVLVTDVISEETYDLSRYVDTINFGQSTELSSTKCELTFATTKGLSPFTNKDTPLFYGNKVKIYSYLEGNEYLEWQGYITEIQSSGEKITITAFDKLVNFNKKLEENLIYSPETQVVKERLKALDGVRFKGSYDSWVASYRPKVWVGGELLKAEEYTVDYYRGEVYIMKNPYLHPQYIVKVYKADELIDRKIANLDFDINLSSTPKVYKTWREKIDYSCVSGVENTQIWRDKIQELIEGIDYIIDYDADRLILKEALPPDSDTAKDYAIRLECRKDIGEVIAEYKYYVPHTNKVEDIIKDLAKKVGFTDSEMEDSCEEEVFSRNSFHFQLSHKGIKSVNWIKVDGELYTGNYNILSTLGLLELDKSSVEAIIDPFETLFKVTKSEDASISLDDEGVVGKSIKVITEKDNLYIEKDYHYYDIYLDLSPFKEVAFMIKPDKDLDYVVLDLVDEDFNSHTFHSLNSLKANEWNECIFNISSYENRDRINSIRIIFPKAGTYKVDYFHTPRHKVEISYKYNTIESTGISASEAHYLSEEVETYKDVLTDIMKLLPPSYRLWVDKNEKLHGRDLKMPFYYILPLAYSMQGLESDNVYGKFLIPDYALTLMSSFEHHISTEQIFNAVEVIGKKSYMEDKALLGEVEDKCVVVSGEVYGGNIAETLRKYQFSIIVTPLISNFDYSVNVPKEKVLIDGDVNTGIYWYKSQRDNPNCPFSTDELLVKLTLPEPIYWTEIVLTVGAYKGKVIRNEFYIECETEDGEKFYPEDVVPTRRSGQTGTHLKFTNKRFPYKKIKYIYIYGSTPFYWFTSEQVGGKK